MSGNDSDTHQQHNNEKGYKSKALFNNNVSCFMTLSASQEQDTFILIYLATNKQPATNSK